MVKQSQPSASTTATPVLLCRPEEQSLRFAAALQERFDGQVRPVLSPLMQPTYLNPPIPEREYAGVVFTSEAAVVATARMTPKPNLPYTAFCVGARTARAAEAAGFTAISANGDADSLLSMILSIGPLGPLLYLCGRETRGNLDERIALAGVPTVSVTVYQQDPQPLSPEANALLCQVGAVVVPLFSPRSARLLCDALPANMAATLALAAMSEAVADVARSIPARQLAVANRPDAEAMLDTVDLLLIGLRGS